MRVGYARVSTLDQSPELQLQALTAAGCEKVYGEKASGDRADRPELKRVLDDVLRDGDTLVVWRLDRLARSLKQLIASLPTVVNGLKSGKVSPVKALWHKKLPDQSQVRRIFKEIESKDERLELNLYIVGESGEEEEGAMAEGSQES